MKWTKQQLASSEYSFSSVRGDFDSGYVVITTFMNKVVEERWFDENGSPHRDNGLPAVVSNDLRPWGGREPLFTDIYYTHGILNKSKKRKKL